MGGHRIHGLLLSTFEVRDFKRFAWVVCIMWHGRLQGRPGGMNLLLSST